MSPEYTVRGRLRGPARWLLVIGGGLVLGGAVFLLSLAPPPYRVYHWTDEVRYIVCWLPALLWVAAGCWGYYLRNKVVQSARLLTVTAGNPGLHYALLHLIGVIQPLLAGDVEALGGVAVFFFVPAAIPSTILMYVTFRRRTDARDNPGHCQWCGYDLTGNVSGRCPECGMATPDHGQDD